MQRLFLSLITVIGCGLIILPSQKISLEKLVAEARSASTEHFAQQNKQDRQQIELLNVIPSIGFNNLVADWTFLRFLQYFGDEEARLQTDYQLSPDYFEVILNRDPYFLDAYMFLPGSTTLYAARPDRTIEIMEKYLPKLSPKAPDQAYLIWRWKAIDELLFLGDVDSAINSYQASAAWATEYDTEEGQFMAEISQRTAVFLKENPASKSIQVSAWMGVYGNAFDDATRQLAIDNIRALGGNVILDEDGNVVEVKTPVE